jgi:hypothetical protein
MREWTLGVIIPSLEHSANMICFFVAVHCSPYLPVALTRSTYMLFRVRVAGRRSSGTTLKKTDLEVGQSPTDSSSAMTVGGSCAVHSSPCYPRYAHVQAASISRAHPLTEAWLS